MKPKKQLHTHIKKNPLVKKIQKWGYIKTILLCMLLIIIINGIYNQIKPLPPGVNIKGEVWNISDDDIQFLADYTFERNNETVHEHEIFDTLFEMIENANKSILIDMFLFNNDYSHQPQHREITDELTSLLVKKRNEEVDIVFITDHLNTFYGSYTPSHIKKLQENNITIIFTNMNKMRDSNPLYTSPWRTFIRWIPLPIPIPHPLGNVEHSVRLDALLEVATARANHRKVAVIDSTTALITSANPHTASSAHSNVGIIFRSPTINEIIKSEENVAKFSGTTINLNTNHIETQGTIQMQLLTEKSIRDTIISDIDKTVEGDTVTVMAFYISDRKVVKALKRASKRGVTLVMILDANKDAFAREKSGIPNRQVAFELAKYAHIRWYHTTGEQYHSKMIVIEKNETKIVHLGSSNFTKRNLGNYNLEMNVKIITPNNTQFYNDVASYMHRIITNEDGLFTTPLETYYDNSLIKYWLYRFQEWSGLSTF